MSNATDFIIEDGVLVAYNGTDSCMEIPEGVTTIGAWLLKENPHVTSVVIPAGITKIQQGAFSPCHLSWDDQKQPFTLYLTDMDEFLRAGSHWGLFFMPNDRPRRFVVKGQLLEELTIPGDLPVVSSIFKNCEHLKKLVISEGITHISDEAFWLCRNLTDVTLPASLENAGAETFSCCPITRLEFPENASFKISKLFGYSYPTGLMHRIDELSQRMDVYALKNYVLPERWKLLSEDSKARIFLTYQDAAMKKMYKKLLKPADFDPLSEAILQRLGQKLSKKECGILADFMTTHVAYLSGSAIKTMYDAVKSQKSGADALKALDANAAVKKKIASAPVNATPKANRGTRSKNDIVFDNMGFDDNGVKIYVLGNKEVHAVIQPDFQVLILDPKTGKTAKSIPKRGADPELYAAAAEDFKALFKGIKSLYNTCKDGLFHLYLTGEKMPLEVWKTEWTGNSITRTLASMVVWQQGETCFILEGKQPVSVAGEPYTLTDEAICLAHTSELTAKTVTVWQRYFITHNRKQPFLQIWEPVRKEADIRTDRYKGVMIRTGYLRNQRTLGVEASFYSDWESDMTFCSLTLKNFDIEVTHSSDEQELEIVKIVPLKWNRQSNAIVSFLDRVSIYGRLHKDDETIAEILDQFTFEQISDFLSMAAKHSLPKVTALLLEYNKNRFEDFDPMDDFILEL